MVMQLQILHEYTCNYEIVKGTYEEKKTFDNHSKDVYVNTVYEFC